MTRARRQRLMPRTDPVLAAASREARAFMARYRAQPPQSRAQWLRAELEGFSPTLYARVEAARNALVRRGAKNEDALYHALRAAMADEVIDTFVEVGRRVAHGEAGVTEALGGRRAREAGKFFGRLLLGATCSPAAVDTATRAASRKGETAAQWAAVGAGALQTALPCTARVSEELPELPPEEPASRFPTGPVLIGGGVLLVIAVIALTMKRRDHGAG